MPLSEVEFFNLLMICHCQSHVEVEVEVEVVVVSGYKVGPNQMGRIDRSRLRVSGFNLGHYFKLF